MADLWTHIGFARVAAVLAGRAGLQFAPNRQPAAEMAMRRVLDDLRLDDPLALARRAAREDDVLDRLLAEVTIGETYFFREPAQLEVVRATALPALRACRSPARPLRAWSAGCASGEEPYTLAILLGEAGFGGGAARVLGTDVSRPRLAAAQRARYTRWSLRGLPEERVSRYFVRRGRFFHLRPELQASVEFRPLNLADRDWSGSGVQRGTMDLVLCRNVLIYLDRATVVEVARRLLESLSDDGWLFLGASDPLLTELPGFETVVTGAGLAYRRDHGRSARRAAAPPPTRAEAPEPARADVEVPVVATRADRAEPVPAARPAPAPRAVPAADGASRYAGRDYAAAAAIARAVVERDPGDADAWILLVRALANAGRLPDAERACETAMARHPERAELPYLHAVLLAQGGRHAASAAAARQALYLDRSLAVAHLALGAALAREGHAATAERVYGAAERLLERLPPDAPVPLADGEPARRLLEAARAQRRRLGEAVA